MLWDVSSFIEDSNSQFVLINIFNITATFIFESERKFNRYSNIFHLLRKTCCYLKTNNKLGGLYSIFFFFSHVSMFFFHHLKPFKSLLEKLRTDFKIHCFSNQLTWNQSIHITKVSQIKKVKCEEMIKLRYIIT